MAVDREEVRRMAELARLELAPEEVDRLAREVGSILEHMEALGRVDAADAWPASPPGPAPDAEEPAVEGAAAEESAVEESGGGAPGPADGPGEGEPEPDPLAEPPEAAAPAWADGFFLVPRLPAMAGEDPDGDEEDQEGGEG